MGKRLDILDRLRRYIVNFIFNGLLGMTAAGIFIWLVIPTSFFFEYKSIEPISIPVAIEKDHIRMVSNIIANNTSGNFSWNDVLRCNYEMDENGYFEYVGQSDTAISTSKKMVLPFVSPWDYTGDIPEREALCQMNSTIRRDVLGFIPKQQFVQSKVFIVN